MLALRLSASHRLQDAATLPTETKLMASKTLTEVIQFDQLRQWVFEVLALGMSIYKSLGRSEIRCKKDGCLGVNIKICDAQLKNALELASPTSRSRFRRLVRLHEVARNTVILDKGLSYSSNGAVSES